MGKEVKLEQPSLKRGGGLRHDPQYCCIQNGQMDLNVYKRYKRDQRCLCGLTSYWVIKPLGSTGSSHFRKIMSSSGVKVSDSGAMPPGTTRNCQNKHLSRKLKCDSHNKASVNITEVNVTAAQNNAPQRHSDSRGAPGRA